MATLTFKWAIQLHSPMPKSDPIEKVRPETFALIGGLEEPLNRALELARAVDLMGLGLEGVHAEYGPSFQLVAEALAFQLETAKSVWRQVMDARTHGKVRHARR